MVKVVEIEGSEQADLLRELEEFVVEEGVAEKIAFLADITWPYWSYNRAFALLEEGMLVGGMVLAQNFASPIWILAARSGEELVTLYTEAQQIQPAGGFFLTEKEYQKMAACRAIQIDEVVFQMHRDRSISLTDQVTVGAKVVRELGLSLEQVEEAELDQLDAFYQQHYYHAWHRDSFQLGPMYWIRRQDEIIAVASCQSKYYQQTMIGNIFVLPQARGQHLGEAIVVKLITDLEAKGVNVGLFVDEINQGAISLYRKLGFEVYQRRIFV